MITTLSQRWGEISPLQKLAIALDPRTKDLYSLNTEIREVVWLELEQKTMHHHSTLEQKRPPTVSNAPFDPFARFSRTTSLLGQVQDEIARWKAEQSIPIREWDAEQHKWMYGNVYDYWKSRSERFPLLSVIAQQVSFSIWSCSQISLRC